MMLQALLNNKVNRIKKALPFLQSLFVPSKRTRRTIQASEAKKSHYQVIIPLSEQTGTRTITYTQVESEEKSSIGNTILIMLVNEYAAGLSKTHLHEDHASSIFQKSFFSKKPAWATGYIIEKYLF